MSIIFYLYYTKVFLKMFTRPVQHFCRKKSNVAKIVKRQLSISGNNFEISEEVRIALDNNSAVVALESTIITHGMPYPQNVKCALDVEQVVRKQVSERM